MRSYLINSFPSSCRKIHYFSWKIEVAKESFCGHTALGPNKSGDPGLGVREMRSGRPSCLESRKIGGIWRRLRAPLGGQKLPREGTASIEIRSPYESMQNEQTESR